jgi:hypothetical protein
MTLLKKRKSQRKKKMRTIKTRIKNLKKKMPKKIKKRRKILKKIAMTRKKNQRLIQMMMTRSRVTMTSQSRSQNHNQKLLSRRLSFRRYVIYLLRSYWRFDRDSIGDCMEDSISNTVAADDHSVGDGIFHTIFNINYTLLIFKICDRAF